MVIRPLASYLTRWRLQPVKIKSQMSSPYVSSFSTTSSISADQKKNNNAADSGQKPASSSDKKSTSGKDCPSTVPPEPPQGEGAGPCDDESDVNFSSCGCKAMILLNRPKKMNALNHCMARKMSFMINKWRCDKNLIVVKGYSNAFCAGGDVVSIAKDRTGQKGKSFFRDEYKLNALISTLEMPYVSLYNGIVMGGGVGISIHGRYRVASECSVFAMPESQIGFFPDVGVSHFLARMPNNLGVFLGLTGYRLRAYDLVHVGIATHYCAGDKLSDLEKDLFAEDNKKTVEEILEHYHNESLQGLCGGQVPVFSLEGNMPIIMSCFCSCCLEDIFKKLECDPCPFSKDILAIMKKCSPLAMKITLRQIREAYYLDLFECLNVDFRLASRFMEGKDFYEGIRAALVDKDRNPKWQHKNVSDVTEEEVSAYFSPLPPEEELGLPHSLNC